LNLNLSKNRLLLSGREKKQGVFLFEINFELTQFDMVAEEEYAGIILAIAHCLNF
jgi:hypothetical protein